MIDMKKKLSFISFIIFSVSNFSFSQHYNPYDGIERYSPDYQLIYNALSQKQSLLNQRRSELNTKINSIWKVVDRIIAKQNGLTESQKDFLISFNNETSRLLQWDFSINENYSTVFNWLIKNENIIYSWL